MSNKPEEKDEDKEKPTTTPTPDTQAQEVNVLQTLQNAIKKLEHKEEKEDDKRP